MAKGGVPEGLETPPKRHSQTNLVSVAGRLYLMEMGVPQREKGTPGMPRTQVESVRGGRILKHILI
jgi:hypothetical protein